jgi:hypothetical protein
MALSGKFILETKEELGNEKFWKRYKGQFEGLHTAKENGQDSESKMPHTSIFVVHGR